MPSMRSSRGAEGLPRCSTATRCVRTFPKAWASPKRTATPTSGGSVTWRGWSRVAALPRLYVGQRELSDLYMLASGGLAPLDSFMGAADYEAVVTTGRLANGHPFTIPIVLRAAAAPTADRLALFVGDQPVGIVDIANA